VENKWEKGKEDMGKEKAKKWREKIGKRKGFKEKQGLGSQEDTDEDREKKKISDGVKRREEIIRGEEEKR